MNNAVYLKDVLEEMRTHNNKGEAIKFDISVRTFNRNSKKGGKLNHYKNAKLVMKEGVYDPTSVQALKHVNDPNKLVKIKKSPSHFTNKTRNLKLESGEIKKININYIIKFNGKKVIY